MKLLRKTAIGAVTGLALMASSAIAQQSLLVGSAQVPRHFNGAIQSGIATAMPGTQLFASPLMYSDSWDPMPYLAESWETSDDGLSVTLKLVEGATFHDGEPITSEDVAFSIMTIKANHPFKT
ncbi:MAG: ABC transporter substrate-binding protein, partial [Pseudooceanicola atlanticus]